MFISSKQGSLFFVAPRKVNVSFVFVTVAAIVTVNEITVADTVLTVTVAVFEVEPGSVNTSVSAIWYPIVPPATKVKVGFPAPSVTTEKVAPVPEPLVLVWAKAEWD